LLVSQAYELALIASGQLDGTVCIKSRGFSSSAGALLVQEAGGMVSDLYGKERTKQSTSLLVSNGLLHEELVKLVNG
jgi:myo-inositol-1(or 4)-monophosphatase